MKISTTAPRSRTRRHRPLPLDDWSPEELARVFQYDARFENVLRYAKGPVNRIALFYHAAYMEAFGQAPPFGGIPLALVEHIAGLLGEALPSPFIYPDARATFFYHSEKARRVLGWQIWVPSTRRGFEHRLAAEARRSDDRDYLRGKIETWLWEAKILHPGPTRIKKMIAQARTHAREWIAMTIVSGLTDEHLARIETLRRNRPGTNRSVLQWLKDPLGSPSPKTLADILDRIVTVRSFALPHTAFENIHPDMRRRLRETIEVYSVDNLYSDFNAKSRQALVACYLYERLQGLIDLAVETFDAIVLGMNRRSEAELAADQRARDPAKNLIVRMFKAMAQIMVDETHVPDPLVRPATYSEVSREDIVEALSKVDDLIRPEDYNFFDYLKARYPYLRSFFPRFLETIEFEGDTSARPILIAIAALRAWNASKVRKLPDSVPLEFVPAKWRSYVCPEKGMIDRHYYEICLLLELHRALQAAEIWAVGGRRYGNVEDLLISPETWEHIRDECCEELKLPRDPGPWLAGVLDSLGKQIVRTTTNLPQNPQVIVFGDRVHLKALEAAPESDNLRTLRTKVRSSWPQVRIQDLLVEVDSWVGFSHLFRSLRGRQQQGEEGGLSRGLLGALIAKGCNIGMTKMSVLTPGVTPGTLRRADETYLYEDALRHVYESLVRAQRDLPISRWLGDPTVSMSDGMRVASRVGTLRAALKPHAFAPGERALTFYWHVSHLGPAYASQVIGHDRDAAYVLDQIFHIQSELPIHAHFTDTHGSNEVTFGESYLFGLEFCPRIKLIHAQNLHFPPGFKVEGTLKKHFEGPVDVELIERYWDDVLRVLASIKRGYTSAVLLTLRLSSYAKQNPIFRALREIGRIFKSRFILRYYDDPELRRKVNAGLTRMENFNSLARHLFFARRGENWEREFEQQLNRASAVVVLANACVLWNSVQLSELVQKLKSEGVEVPAEEFRHISPYANEHIIPYGEYTFDLRRKGRQEAYLNAREL